VVLIRSSRERARSPGFEIDLSSGELRKLNGRTVRIQPKPLQMLRLLLQAEGKVVTREELRLALWPEKTFVDFEHGVNTAVKKLRQALDDSAENPSSIETLPKIGYRFIAPVEWIDDPDDEGSIPRVAPVVSTEEASVAQPVRLTGHWKITAAVVVAALLALAGTAVLLFDHKGDVATSRPGMLASERRLTANPEDTPVTSGVISPDGKYLAYTDATGLYLRQVDSGETHPVSLPKGFDALAESWFSDSAHLVISRVEHPLRPPSLWVISVMGGTARKITDEGFAAAVSPDGSRIIFLKENGAGQEIWLAHANGDGPRRLLGSETENFSQLGWAPDGKRFAYARTKTRYYTSRSGPDTQIEIFDTGSERTAVIRYLGERGLPRGGAALGWTPDGQLIYPVREPRPNQQDTNLWRQQLDRKTAQPRSQPTRLTNGRGIAVQLSFTSDGRRIALRRHAPQPDIYVADLERGGKKLGTLQRLTLDERLDYAMSWTADSQFVVFTSNRDGPFHVFKQTISATQPELLVGGEDDLYVPRLSPDGLSVLYVVRAKPGGASDKARLMRVPLAGGPPQFVLEDYGIWDIECARLPSRLCIYSKIEKGQQAFFTFDPAKGKGVELGVSDPDGDNFDWCLSRDGNYIAWARNRTALKEFGLRILSLSDGRKRDIAVPGWVQIYGLDWAADGRSLWVTAYNMKGTRALLNVGLDGNTRTMLSYQNQDLEWAIPSPDGRRLAIVKDSNSSNVWLLENDR
jgi:Tol biopolymer transport system component/DNA-binding winged helix-turn-helix (wHTH) protein